MDYIRFELKEIKNNGYPLFYIYGFDQFDKRVKSQKISLNTFRRLENARDNLAMSMDENYARRSIDLMLEGFCNPKTVKYFGA